MVLTLITRSPRCPGFLATVACASYRRLDPSVAGSGPHAFAVRRIAPSSLAPPASIASRPAFRDDREPPLCVGRDGRINNADFTPPSRKSSDIRNLYKIYERDDFQLCHLWIILFNLHSIRIHPQGDELASRAFPSKGFQGPVEYDGKSSQYFRLFITA
jgi:hypothetical protein